MDKKTYLTTGKNRITGIGKDPVDGKGVALELDEKDGERLVRLGACFPHGHVMVTNPKAPAKLTVFDAIKKAVENGKMTKNNGPEIHYLEGLLDRNITPKERDEAWEEYQFSTMDDGK